MINSYPYGYRQDPDDTSKKIPDDREQFAITEMHRLRGLKYGYHKICNELSRLGHKPRGRDWYPMTVRAVLNRTPRAI